MTLRENIRDVFDILLKSSPCRACGRVVWGWQRCPCRLPSTHGFTPGKYLCCRAPSNRLVVEVKTEDDPQAFRRLWWIRQQFVAWGWMAYPQRPHSIVEKCRACGRRHIRGFVRQVFQPGKVGIR